MITPINRVELAEAQQRIRSEVRAPEVRHANVDTAAELEIPDTFAFGGVIYRVPPIPWPDGMRLERVRSRLVALQAEAVEDWEEYQELVAEAARLIARLVTPASAPLRWLRRLRLLGDPFRAATEAEIGALAGFLSMSRTRSRLERTGAPRPARTRATRREA